MILCLILEYEQIDAHYDADIKVIIILFFMLPFFPGKEKRKNIIWINKITFY